MQHVSTGVLLLALAVVVVASILGALALYDVRQGHTSNEKGE